MICVIGAGRLELYVHCACALYSRVSFFNTMRKGLSQGDTCVCVLVCAYERVCVWMYLYVYVNVYVLVLCEGCG